MHLLELMALFVVWFINWAGQMLYLGTSPMVQIILTFLIVLSITCYLVGALYAYLYEVRVKRREKKRRTLIAQGSEAPQQQHDGDESTRTEREERRRRSSLPLLLLLFS